MIFKTELFDAQKHNEKNFIYTLYTDKGSEGLVKFLQQCYNDDNTPLIEEFYYNMELISPRVKNFRIKEYAKEVITIYMEDGTFMYWLPLEHMVIISEFVEETYSDKFTYGFIAGTMHPIPSAKGFISSARTNGYELWIKNN